MADPLLTSLCTICHIQSPKYRCPRCGTRTCSLTCVTKHKKWSSCNGERDPTIYIPREKLKTDAGIDHDYNFLTKIERSVERAEKILREERDILPEESVTSRPPPNKRARLHKGQSRGRVTFEENSRKWDRSSIQRMRQLGIHVSSVPYGMARAKENKSSWNRRTKTMNWQVEWLEWKTFTPEENGKPQPSRMLYKVLDETPLYIGFAETQEYHRRVQLSDQERAQEKKQKASEKKILAGGGQDVTSTAWSGQEYVIQDSRTGAWNDVISGSYAIEGLKARYRFYYLKPRTPSREQHKLIPLRPTENLATILPGLDIVEFPTICVLPANSTAVPDGYAVENRPRKSKKRQASGLVEYASEEEGEAADDGSEGQEEADDTTSSSGSDSDI
ncbi:Carbon-nitrogen hydrolase [Hypoxylon texense]